MVLVKKVADFTNMFIDFLSFPFVNGYFLFLKKKGILAEMIGLLRDVTLGQSGRDIQEEDCLEFHHYANVLGEMIVNTPGPFSLGIFGNWGTGKTTLMKFIERYLLSTYQNKAELPLDFAPSANSTTPAPAVIPVWCNAWRYENETVCIIPLLDTIQEAVEEHLAKVMEKETPSTVIFPTGQNSFSVQPSSAGPSSAGNASDKSGTSVVNGTKEKIGHLKEWIGNKFPNLFKNLHLQIGIPGLISLATGYPTGGAGNFWGNDDSDDDGLDFDKDERGSGFGSSRPISVKAGKQKQQGSSPTYVYENSPYNRAFKLMQILCTRLESALPGTRIVVFLDDLDRSSPEKAVHLLDTMRLFLWQPCFTFVIALAPGTLEYYLSYVLKDVRKAKERTGREYLDKLIQYSFSIPFTRKHVIQFTEHQLEKQGWSEEDRALFTDIINLLHLTGKCTQRKIIRVLNNVIIRAKICQKIQNERNIDIPEKTWLEMSFISGLLENMGKRRLLPYLLSNEELVGRMANWDAATWQKLGDDPGLLDILPKGTARRKLWEIFVSPPGKFWLNHPAIGEMVADFSYNIKVRSKVKFRFITHGDHNRANEVIEEVRQQLIQKWQSNNKDLPLTTTQIKLLDSWDCGGRLEELSPSDFYELNKMSEHVFIVSTQPLNPQNQEELCEDLLKVRELYSNATQKGIKSTNLYLCTSIPLPLKAFALGIYDIKTMVRRLEIISNN